MTTKNLVNKWILPDRTNERKACSVRINYDVYAKCQALKETFPNRSLNDIFNDLIESAVNEVVASLPSYDFDIEDRIEFAHQCGGHPDDYVGGKKGPGVTFENNYARILNDKTIVDSKDEQQDEAV